ncbi:MAG: hypothetical protein ABIN97_11515, partial [Ginsengibacter sp.]
MKKNTLLTALFIYCIQLTYSQSGQLDPSFGNNGIVKSDMGAHFNYNNTGRQVLIHPDGSIYILLNSQTFITKRLPDGSIDASYGVNGYSRALSFNDAYAALQTDSKMVIAGSANDNFFYIARLNANGKPDSTFGDNGMQTTAFAGRSFATSVAIQSDGKIVVAGYTTNANNDAYFAVARYNSNG